MDDNRYQKQSYELLKIQDEVGRTNWVSFVEIIAICDLLHVIFFSDRLL